MTGGPSTNFHGVGIGPLSKILAVKVMGLEIMVSPDSRCASAHNFTVISL